MISPGPLSSFDSFQSTEQQVVVELLSQHPLGAKAVDRRGPTALGIQLAEGGVEPIKSLIHLGAAVGALLDDPDPSAQQRGMT